MRSRRIIWVIITLLVLTTITVTLGTSDRQNQEKGKQQTQPTPTPVSPFGDMSKYPVANLDRPESTSALELEVRIIKNKRYDNGLIVTKAPSPDEEVHLFSDAEPIPPPIPFAESSLIVVGEVQHSIGLLSKGQKTVYSEYSIIIRSILKKDPKKTLQVGEIISADRSGGVVRYPNGQRILYLNDWQDLPELTKKYLFFLNNDDDQNPNYKILTGYQLSNGLVLALDKSSIFREFNGMKETDFISLVLAKK